MNEGGLAWPALCKQQADTERLLCAKSQALPQPAEMGFKSVYRVGIFYR